MPRKSKIEKLPQEIQDVVNKLLKNGRSIDAITEKLKELNVDVSRSSVGRYAKNFNDVIDRFKEIEHFASALGANLEDKSHGEIARMNAQLLQGSLFKIMMGNGEEEVLLDPKEVMQLARTIESLAKASKLDVDRELKIREEAAKEARVKAAESAVKIAKKEGFSVDTVNKIKSEILGVEV